MEVACTCTCIRYQTTPTQMPFLVNAHQAVSSGCDVAMSKDQFKVPSWAGLPPPGLHLDVVKNDSVLQKLLVDEKRCYLFGRDKDSCDFPLQHQSCSRQHAALVYHKHLNRPFLIDLGSTHGTFVGTLRLEPFKPTQIPVDTTLSFGASTRTYTLRERPQTVSLVGSGEGGEGEGGTLLGLPELDTDVDDLTQYNTAHNRQISMVGIQEDERPRKRRYRANSVSFSDQEEIINPEDIDPSVGKFRNMVQTTIVPTKKPRLAGDVQPSQMSPTKFTQPLSSPTALYTDIPSPSSSSHFTFGSVLIARTISAAPPVANPAEHPHNPPQQAPAMATFFSDQEPRKKKYAKEAWPGKKPTHLLL